MGFGDKGATAKGNFQLGRKLFGSAQHIHRVSNIGIGFVGYAHHAVELDPLQAACLSIGDRLINFRIAQFFVDDLAQSFRTALHCYSDGTAIMACQNSTQAGGQGVSAHRSQTEAHRVKLWLVEPVQQSLKLRVLGNRCPQQTKAIGYA